MNKLLTIVLGKLVLLSGFLILSPPAVGQQPRNISGTVLDLTMLPIPAVTVEVKGKRIQTLTDGEGKYTIKVESPQDVLVFRSVGYSTVEKNAPAGNQLNVTMESSSQALDEVVVAVGYGTVRRKDITGSVASIKAEELRDIPAVSVLQAIAGRLPGVNVTVTEGSPDAEVKVRVRGGGSITQDNAPLYIVDGFQVPNINDIPMTDIETIDVLKDAASTAIYGAQGANGVVLITTKTGKKGKSEITFSSYLASSNVYNLTDVLSPYDYVYYQRELDPSTSSNNSFNSMYGLWEDIDIYKSNKALIGRTDFMGTPVCNKIIAWD